MLIFDLGNISLRKVVCFCRTLQRINGAEAKSVVDDEVLKTEETLKSTL